MNFWKNLIHYFHRGISFAFVLSFSFKALSQNQLNIEKALNSKPGSSQLKLKDMKEEKSAEVNSQVQWTSRYYQSSNTEFYRDSAQAGQSEILLSFKTSEKSKGGGFDIENRYQLEESSNYFRPSEIFFKASLGSNNFFFGRKILNWSRSDELWKRGVFQPRHMDDPLEAKAAGLTGLFFSRKNKKHSFIMFASPVYIPEFGPRASVINGSIASSNPWFSPPTNKISINDNVVSLDYSIERPEIDAIVFNESAGGKYQYESSRGLFSSLSYLYKPMNHLMFGVPVLLNLNELETDITVEARIRPRVEYHHVTSLTTGLKGINGWTAWGEGTFIRPESRPESLKWITEAQKEAFISTLGVEKAFSSGSSSFSRVWLSYSRVTGGDREDWGELAPEESLFQRRFQYQQSLLAGWEGRLYQNSQFQVNGNTQLIYDWLQEGGVWSSSLNTSWRSGWQVFMAYDLIGRISKNPKIDKGFTGDYRANDRVSGGVGYGF